MNATTVVGHSGPRVITSAVTRALAGLLMGYVLQRGQLCVHSAIRNSLDGWFLPAAFDELMPKTLATDLLTAPAARFRRALACRAQATHRRPPPAPRPRLSDHRGAAAIH